MPNYTLRRLVVAMVGLVLVAGLVAATRSTIEVDCTPGRHTVQEGDTLWAVFHQVCDGDVADLANKAQSRLGEGFRPGTVIEVTESGLVFARVELARRVHQDISSPKEEILHSADERGERATLVGQDVTILVTFIELHRS